MEIQSRASTLASFLDWICFSVCSLYFKEKVTSVNHWVPLQSFYPAPTMQCFIFSWVAVMHAMRVKQTNWEMPGAFSLIFWFLFPCKCKENTTLHHSLQYLLDGSTLHSAQETMISPICSIAFSLPLLVGKQFTLLQLLPCFYLSLFPLPWRFFRVAGTAGRDFSVLCDHFPQWNYQPCVTC